MMLWQPTRGILQPNQHWRRPQTPAAAGATTWDPSKKNANIVLDGTKLVATASGGGGAVMSIAPVGSSQKVYIEYVPTVNADNQQFGFATTAYDLIQNPFNPDPAYFTIHFSGVYQDGGSADNGAAMPAWTTGDRVGIALDRGANKFWSRVNGGPWSNSGDPAAGTGGRSVSTAGTIYAMVHISYSTEVTTARFDSTAWVDLNPSGYTQLA